jgi:hypothetical protein
MEKGVADRVGRGFMAGEEELLQQGVQLHIIQRPFAIDFGMDERRKEVRLWVVPALGNQGIGITPEGSFCTRRFQLLFIANPGNSGNMWSWQHS